MKNRKRLVSILAGVMAAIMILSLLFSILPSRVWAASSSEIRKQINALQQDRKDIKEQIADVKNQYQANTDEIADIVARKNVIDQEIGLLHAEIININDQLSAYSVLIADQQDELDRAQARYDELNSDCKTRIRAMEEEGTISYWEVLFKANSFSDLLDRLNMVEEIATSDSRTANSVFWWVPPAPANPPSSSSSAVSCGPPPAPFMSTAIIWSASASGRFPTCGAPPAWCSRISG